MRNQQNWVRWQKTGYKEGLRRIQAHRDKFSKLWDNFVEIAEWAIEHRNAIVAIEWPRVCAYWADTSVREFLDAHQMVPAHFDGCMYGVECRKPWTVYTNSHELATGLAWKKTCTHKCKHPTLHGEDLKLTGSYTPQLAKRIHDCFRHVVEDENRSSGLRGVSKVTLPQNHNYVQYTVRN